MSSPSSSKYTCVVCYKHASLGISVPYQCGHYTHGDCTEDNPDFTKCPQCLGRQVPEPLTVEGDINDYVVEPGERKEIKTGWISSLVSKKAAAAPPTALSLLAAKTPIQQMFQAGYGLQHMLKEGASWDDFANSYSWADDMSLFADVKKRPIQVLSALQFRANDLRDMTNEADKEALLKIITPSALCNQFGLHFPENGSLQCDGDEHWNAEHCVKLRLTMDDLIDDLGMKYVEQYEDLLAGLSSKRAVEAEKALKVTAKHADSLISLRQEEEEEEEVEEEEEEVTPPPAAAKAAPKKKKSTTPPPPAAQGKKSTRRAGVAPVKPKSSSINANLYLARAEKMYAHHEIKE